jgi:preprotein translocase SecE subunit
VARDRQRAKQRRAKRQPGAGGPAAGSASTNARDIGLDQADADDAGLGSTTPPEPTKHAMPHVEEAHMAEAGPADYDDGAPDEVDGAPDEVEGDLVPAARPGAAERAAHARPRKRRSGVIGFLGHCVDELKRVQWPDRRQVGQGTAVTLGFTVLAGGYLGLLDAIWKPLIEAIL